MPKERLAINGKYQREQEGWKIGVLSFHGLSGQGRARETDSPLLHMDAKARGNALQGAESRRAGRRRMGTGSKGRVSKAAGSKGTGPCIQSPAGKAQR